MSSRTTSVDCPVCGIAILGKHINDHLDSECKKYTHDFDAPSEESKAKPKPGPSKLALAPIFSQSSKGKRPVSSRMDDDVDAEIEILDSDFSVTTGGAKKENKVLPPPAKRPKTTQANVQAAAPLAERMRPMTLDDVVGHEHMTAADSLLRNLMGSGGTGSMILWGPAGCGKTTLARLLAQDSGARIVELSATSSGTAEVRAAFEAAKNTLKITGKRTVLFMDEIHRFNKSQQDLFLPYIEQGLVQLIGATTENPSFKINNALLSRCRVFVLERLTDENVREILHRTLQKVAPNLVPQSAEAVPDLASHPPSSSPLVPPTATTRSRVSNKILDSIVSLSTGDARTALSLLELAISAAPSTPEETLLTSLRKSVIARYDRSGDDRYDMISALHKSVRGGDGGAAMYWLARMLTAGEDPLYVARRCIVMASEDIGLANDRALPLALATYNACTIIGMPECRINLAHCVAYLAESPKSTRSYEAYNKAAELAQQDPTLPVPVNIRNAPTSLMKDLGYGKEYLYNPGYAHPVHGDYLPLQLSKEKILRKENDLSEKAWNEELLRQWEWQRNGGDDWEGRPTAGSTDKKS